MALFKPRYCLDVLIWNKEELDRLSFRLPDLAIDIKSVVKV